ncbi:hypothetical protein SAMN05444679_102158 [Variovorax sp. CF079]|nr:hypothetical protein SAMN05444679_102158 [Variovorax sp. CF079]
MSYIACPKKHGYGRAGAPKNLSAPLLEQVRELLVLSIGLSASLP